jgi:hypothetical protein
MAIHQQAQLKTFFVLAINYDYISCIDSVHSKYNERALNMGKPHLYRWKDLSAKFFIINLLFPLCLIAL